MDIKEKLVKTIKDYLVALQSGDLGVPTRKELSNAGLLHAFLEDK